MSKALIEDPGAPLTLQSSSALSAPLCSISPQHNPDRAQVQGKSHRLSRIFRLTFLCLLLTHLTASAQLPVSAARSNLVQAILAEDEGIQIGQIKTLASAAVDPLLQQALASWRQGGVFIYETND